MSRERLTPGGLFNSLAESKSPPGRAYEASNVTTEKGRFEATYGYVLHSERPSAHASDLGHGLGVAAFTLNGKQTLVLTGSPTGGTFKLSWNGSPGSANINYNATAGDLQAALIGLSTLADDNVLVTGGPFTVSNNGNLIYNTLFVEFTGSLAGTDVPLLVLDTNALTGGTTPSVAIAEYQKGGEHEKLLAVVQTAPAGVLASTSALYEIDLIAGGAWTALDTDLYAAVTTEVWNEHSEWYMHQFLDAVYLINYGDRGRKRLIGGTTSVSSRPKPPGTPPLPRLEEPHPFGDAGSIITAAATPDATGGGFSGAPALVWNAAAGMLTVTTTAAEDGIRFIDLDFSSAQDYQFQDSWWIEHWVLDPTTTQVRATPKLTLHKNSGSVDTDAIRSTSIKAGDYTNNFLYHFENDGRFDRLTTNTLRITFDLKAAAAKTLVFVFKAYDVWMNDISPVPFSGSSIEQVFNPTFGPIDYAFSYVNSSTATESDLSPVRAGLWQVGKPRGGWNWKVQMAGSSEAGVDRIYLYRRRRSDSLFYRVPNADGTFNGIANATGLQTMYDKWMEEDIEDMNWPVFQQGSNPLWSRYANECIHSWKQCLAVGASRKVYLSRVGQPERFGLEPDDVAPSPDPDGLRIIDNSTDDLRRGRTDFIANNRSDQPLGVWGSDPLYAVGKLGIYAMVGDRPAGASVFRQLPGTRGAIAKRGVYGTGGGIAVGTIDGLYYYSIGRGFQGEADGPTIQREWTDEVRGSWDDFSSPSTTVTVTATSATQTVGSTAGMYVGDSLYFATANVYRTVSSITDATTVVLTASVTGTETEVVTNVTARQRIVVLEFEDVLHCFCDKRYLRQNRNSASGPQWEAGTLAHEVRAAVGVPGRGVFFQGRNGKVYQFSKQATTYAGTEIAWSWSTGILEGPRSRIESIEADVEGNGCTVSIDQYDISSDGSEFGVQTSVYALSSGKRFVPNIAIQPSARYKITVSGNSASDRIDSLFLWFKEEKPNYGS